MEVRNLLEKLGVDTTELDVMGEENMTQDPLYKALNSNEKKSYKTIITSDLIIEGDLVSASSILIEGKVNGNVASNGDVSLKGEIEGDVIARNLKVLSGKIKGEVKVKSRILVDEDSVIVGNIKSASVKSMGNIKGDLDVVGEVEVFENASIEGNVSAGMISIKEGAKFNGSLSMRGM